MPRICPGGELLHVPTSAAGLLAAPWLRSRASSQAREVAEGMALSYDIMRASMMVRPICKSFFQSSGLVLSMVARRASARVTAYGSCTAFGGRS